MGVCAKASDHNRYPATDQRRGPHFSSEREVISIDSQLSRPIAGGRGFAESCSCCSDLGCACAHGGVVLLLCYFGAGGAELVLCQSLEASFGVADGFQDPRATSFAVLGSWTWLAESHGVVALGTTVCVPVLGQV